MAQTDETANALADIIPAQLGHATKVSMVGWGGQGPGTLIDHLRLFRNRIAECDGHVKRTFGTFAICLTKEFEGIEGDTTSGLPVSGDSGGKASQRK